MDATCTIQDSIHVFSLVHKYVSRILGTYQRGMNILFFLTPKSDVAYIEDSFSLRQILEKMEIHRYSAIPILSNTGEYVGTITEGDILWYCKRNSMNALKTAESIFLNDIPKKFEYASVSISSNMEDLIARAMVQNFVPVVDDQNKFIGIVTRKDIIGYCYKKLKTSES